MHTHPKRNEHGAVVPISRPSVASPLAAWLDPHSVATVLPEGPMPRVINGIAFDSTDYVPPESLLAEPAFHCPPGRHPAAGVVIEEPDQRIWLVAPTNQFGAYQTTFPKGRLEPGASCQHTACREAWEEAGLLVELTAFLCDVPRSQTYTRYYRARRLAGHPANMGWETQAVLLVPRSQLRAIVQHPNDQPILNALEAP